MRSTKQAFLLCVACTIRACTAWPFFVDEDSPLYALRSSPKNSLDGTKFDLAAPIDWDFLKNVSICDTVDDLEFSVQVTSNKETGALISIPQLQLVTTAADGDACIVEELIELEDIQLDSYGYHKLTVVLTYGEAGQPSATVETTFGVTVIPAPLAVLPPIVTLVCAGLTQNVMVSLFLGISVGATFLNNYNPVAGVLRTLDTYLPLALGCEDHAKVVLFTIAIGGMVGILIRSGGAAGLAQKMMKFADNPMTGSLAIWCLGILLFFDDYANILIRGGTLLPVSDQVNISHEKMAFLVHATSAPLAAIAPVSSWVGYQVGLVDTELTNLGIDDSAYLVFLKSVPKSFYSIYVIIFGFAIILMRRDLGAMYTAEIRARSGGGVQKIKEDDDDHKDGPVLDEKMKPKEGVECLWYNAVIPVISVVITVFVALIVDGYYALEEGQAESVKNMFSEADSYNALMYGSFVGLLVPMALLKYQHILEPNETMHIWIDSMGDLVEPLLVLIHAWAIGDVINDLGLSIWLSQELGDSLTEVSLPTVTFLASAFIAFCTGTSWGTMAIMIPIVLNLADSVGGGDIDLITKALGTVLAGAVFGDHCSPISDSTVLSSLACKCDVWDHVVTQAPYAFFVGMVSILFGYLPHAAGLNEWACIFLGATFIIGTVRIFFRVVPDDPIRDPSPPVFWEKFFPGGPEHTDVIPGQTEHKQHLLS